MNDSILKQAGINTVDGLKYSGESVELYDSILEIFIGEVEKQRSTMNKQLNDGDYTAFAISAHSVKSNSRTIGATKLYELALAMEKSGDAADVEYISNNWDEFIKIWDNVIDGIEQYLTRK